MTSKAGEVKHKTTIGHVLRGEVKADLGDCHIYVVRDGDTVLYVGQSKWGVLARLSTHLNGGYGDGPSRLGKLVKANLPNALAWQVEFRRSRYKTTVPPTAGGVLGLFPADSGFDLVTRRDLDRAEKELIKELRPCLNVANNPSPSKLPEHYRKPGREPNLETTVSDFIPFRG